MSPELPEVETFKKYIDTTTLNHKIKDIVIRDSRVLKMEGKVFKESLIGRILLSTKRHGKYLFIDVKSLFLILHFGMSGDLAYFNKIEQEPKHSRVLFIFENGNFLSYISQRMFGKLDLINDIDDYIKKRKIGIDAFHMSYEEFKEALKKRTAFAKSALMNQKIIAGIGNIYSDEILFQAKIHPKTKINKISNKKLEKLFEVIKKVLQVGIEKKGDLATYPNDFLIPHRKQNAYCPDCGKMIQRLSLSQRHGFFCPNCQKLNNNNSDE